MPRCQCFSKHWHFEHARCFNAAGEDGWCDACRTSCSGKATGVIYVDDTMIRSQYVHDCRCTCWTDDEDHEQTSATKRGVTTYSAPSPYAQAARSDEPDPEQVTAGLDSDDEPQRDAGMIPERVRPRTDGGQGPRSGRRVRVPIALHAFGTPRICMQYTPCSSY